MFTSLSLAFLLLVTGPDDTQGVCSSSCSITPSSLISLSFARDGSSRTIGTFLSVWTTGGTEGSIPKSNLVASYRDFH